MAVQFIAALYSAFFPFPGPRRPYSDHNDAAVHRDTPTVHGGREAGHEEYDD